MVRPANFGYNAQTATNNSFQNSEGATNYEVIKAQAQAEFEGLATLLREAGVNVVIVEDSPHPIKPDAVFPNNWVSFHADGQVFLYPMYAENRRLERRHEVVESLNAKFEVNNIIDLSLHEADNRFLEGTGSMIIDREHQVIYACISPRTNESLFYQYCDAIDYQPVAFRSVDRSGSDIYHTNVVMALGETFVVICMETVKNEPERELLYQCFEDTAKEVIEITLEQLEHFAGNMLQVRNTQGDTFLVMSEQAFKSLNSTQIAQITEHTTILQTPLYTIEMYGGGSARCMLAELFLPKR
ncbi:MAG: hypothetical protein RI894_2682 [Bacteroidota bacterium]|jgi:hypothetical protein